jgi:hypothetical protein
MINITYVNEMDDKQKVIASLISAFEERSGRSPNEADLSKIISWANVIAKGQKERLSGQLK